MQDKSKLSARRVTPASHAGQVTGDNPSNCDPPESPAPASEPGGPAPGHTGPASEPGSVTNVTPSDVILPNVVDVDEFTVTDPGVIITIVDDQQKVVAELRLTIEQLHEWVQNALDQGEFNYGAFLKWLDIDPDPDRVEDVFWAIIDDYLKGEIPLPDELVWDALAAGVGGGA